MPNCPNCGAEYPEGATNCPICGNSVAPQPAEAPEQPAPVAGEAMTPPESAEQPVVVYEAPNLTMALAAKSALERADIPVTEEVVQGQPDGTTAAGGPYSRISTSASHAEQAKQVIAELLAAYQGTAPAAVATPGEVVRLHPHRGGTVLALGIIGLILSQATCCLGIIFGILAVALANQDLFDMNRGAMDPRGRDSTVAGRTCGIIAIIIGILYTLALVTFLLIAAASGQMSDWGN